MPKGNFIVMKTASHPFISKLKLFFKWEVEFDAPIFYIEDKGTRKVQYTDKEQIEEAILEEFPPIQCTPSGRQSFAVIPGYLFYFHLATTQATSHDPTNS